jgi:pilus assembly protein Flp/PilA
MGFAYAYAIRRERILRPYLAQNDRPASASRVTGDRCPMFSHFQRFLKDESGATAIEYGLIAAGISIAIIAVVNGLGTSLNVKFKSISTQLN